MDKILKSYITPLAKLNNISQSWYPAYSGILDSYLGVVPEKFTYKGKSYTPKTFAENIVKLNPDDYISITSYTHHPFYSEFALEIPDNWLWGVSYNVSLDELLEIANYAIDNGYTIAWGADISEPYFSHSKGVAVVPDLPTTLFVATEFSRWEKTHKNELQLDKPATEKKITQKMRQTAFDCFRTTDDHGMHITGKAKDQRGTEYFIVKNSWNTDKNNYNGYLYVSDAYFKYKTMNYVVHKNAIPKHIREKLKI